MPIDVLRPLVDAAQTRRGSATDGAERASLDEALAAAREALEGATRDSLPVESAAGPALSPQTSELPVRGEKDSA